MKRACSAQLHHQYIAPIYEVGCDEDGRYYLVMDYVHGETAEAVLEARGRPRRASCRSRSR